MKLERFSGNPIIAPNPWNEWESLVTCNPGAWYDQDKKQVIMLYRAAGNDPEHRIRFGLAVSEDGYHFRRVSKKPVFGPSENGFDGGCVEDARIVKFGEWYAITYAARPFPPGQYWLKDPTQCGPAMPEDFPPSLRLNLTASGLALTKDFKTFIRAGRMTSPQADDRDVILFPEKIRGKYVMLHRPAHWTGKKYGTEFPAMWIAKSDDMLTWSKSKLLAKAKFKWEKKIGGSTPPIKTPHGWLTLYHAVGADKQYRVGAMLLDLKNPSIVRHRTKNWLLEPKTKIETKGFYNGVVFPCANVVINGKLFVYYMAGDRFVSLATCDLAELVGYVRSFPG